MGILSSIGGFLLGSTAGRIILGIAGFLIWLHFHDAGIRKEATAACNAKHLSAAVEERARQDAVLETAQQDAEKRAAADDMALARAIQEQESINAKMGKAGLGPCAVPRDITRGMRRIR
jgi:hypothetical protein